MILIGLITIINKSPSKSQTFMFQSYGDDWGMVQMQMESPQDGPPIYVCWFINHERTPFLYYVVVSTMFSHASRVMATGQASLASLIPPGHVVGGPRRELLAASVGPVTAMSYVESWEPWEKSWGKSWEGRGITRSIHCANGLLIHDLL